MTATIDPTKIFYCNAGNHMTTGDGFAVNEDGTYRTCYQCCALVDRARMDASGDNKLVELILSRYDAGYPLSVCNMPQTLCFRIVKRTEGRIWFNGPGGKWYGRITRDGRVTHARRLKHK